MDRENLEILRHLLEQLQEDVSDAESQLEGGVFEDVHSDIRETLTFVRACIKGDVVLS